MGRRALFTKGLPVQKYKGGRAEHSKDLRENHFFFRVQRGSFL